MRVELPLLSGKLVHQKDEYFFWPMIGLHKLYRAFDNLLVIGNNPHVHKDLGNKTQSSLLIAHKLIKSLSKSKFFSIVRNVGNS
ncbi:MAG: hypothetical protein L0I05_09635, partial [Lactobacillus sp.]|uniref:hypothetical protein n=1 Tax=Lactobacillus sp. TaxID=1591 RepID=UPI002647B690